MTARFLRSWPRGQLQGLTADEATGASARDRRHWGRCFGRLRGMAAVCRCSSLRSSATCFRPEGSNMRCAKTLLWSLVILGLTILAPSGHGADAQNKTPEKAQQPAKGFQVPPSPAL